MRSANGNLALYFLFEVALSAKARGVVANRIHGCAFAPRGAIFHSQGREPLDKNREISIILVAPEGRRADNRGNASPLRGMLILYQ